jgi:hypothetical protein
MAEVLPRHYLFGVLAFTLFIVAGVSLLGIFKAQDPSFATDDSYARFNASFNQLEDVSTTVGALQTGITNSDTDFGVFGVLNALISSAWQSLKLMFTSFGIMNDAYNGLSTVFGVPSWIPGLVILAVIIMIAFTIYSAIFQKEL